MDIEWISVNDRLPDIPDGNITSAAVLSGFWYIDPHFVEGKNHIFSCGVSRMIGTDDILTFPQGKQWLTYGPSHNQITHWTEITPPKDTL